ncbi:MAG TPA: DNA translocase FtsK [Bacteroidia bacterium]|nr:DNA translocase FtsK [Bacteroidia bacterium]
MSFIHNKLLNTRFTIKPDNKAQTYFSFLENEKLMSEKTNTFRKKKQDEDVELLEIAEAEPENKPKNKPKAKRQAVEKAPSKVRFTFLKDNRFRQVAGLLLMLMSVLIFIAFASYIFTWRADHDKVTNSWLTLIFDQETKVDNWLGKFGAIVSHFFVYGWFGISSFAFPFIFFLVGFKTVFKESLIPFKKSLGYAAFTLLFLSVAFGFLLKQNTNLLFMGGAFGFSVSNWLELVLGKIGTGLFLFFVAISFVLVAFKLTLKLPAFSKSPTTKTDDLIDTNLSSIDNTVLPVTDTPINVKIDYKEVDLPLEVEEQINELLTPPVAETQKPSNELELETDLPFEINDEPKEEGITLSIESNLDDLINKNPEENNQPEQDTEGEDLPEQVTLGEYDPKLDLSSYQYPHLDLLENYQSKSNLTHEELKAELESNKNRIVETLGHYNIAIEKIKATVGPTVTLFEIVPQAGIRISKIKNLEDDIALSLSALGIRIIAPIPGKGTIGIEVPNQKAEMVPMKAVLGSEKFLSTEMDLPIGLGKTISNEVFVTDLAKMPHLLMAGATGQGKSVGLNAILASLLYKKHPSQVKFVLVDPKKVELTLFKTIERHFLAKLPGEEEAIITDTKKVVNTLNSLCIEMDQRYELLKDAQVRNIREYNVKFVARRLNPNKGHRFLPFIVLVVDEFADLIMTAGKEVETPIARLAQLARAIGIHLIIATQRPSVNIITGTIKANFPARIAFRVTSKIDSRTILDTGGAEQLIGRGDMLLSTGSDLVRLQCAFVDTPEVDKITEFIGSQRGYPDAFLLPEYVGEEGEGGSGEVDLGDRDPLFDDAARMVVQHQQGSASLLQRRLKLGYNRAGRLIDQLEAAGIIGPFEGSKAREVKCKDPGTLEQILSGLK